MVHRKRLRRLQDLFSTMDNTYVQKELELLENEIDLSIMKTKIESIKENTYGLH